MLLVDVRYDEHVVLEFEGEDGTVLVSIIPKRKAGKQVRLGIDAPPCVIIRRPTLLADKCPSQ